MTFNYKYGSSSPEKQVTGLGVYFVSLGKEALNKSFILCNKLRQEGISSDFYSDDPDDRLKKQLREANRQDAQFAVIIGENELNKDIIILKDMIERTQKEISIKNDDMTELLKELEESLF